MTSYEIIDKGESFAAELAAKLCDPDTSVTSKQVFFMDNHERIQKIMGALNKIVSSISTNAISSNGEITEEDELNLKKAKQIVADMKDTITNFQKLLTIDENIQEEDLPSVALTPETTAGIIKYTNSKKKDKNASIKNKLCNYVLVVDGKSNFIRADTKEELNEAINSIINTNDYEDVSLYYLNATPLPLKKKVVFSI